MMGLRDSALTVALGALLTAGLWGWGQQQRLNTEQERTKSLNQRLGEAQEESRRNLANTNEVIATLTTVREGQAQLLMLQGELRTGLAQRERQIEDLKHGIKELQEWADRPLPGAARRLRERPAIIGADAYRKWLSGSGAVHPPGDSPDQQRPVAD